MTATASNQAVGLREYLDGLAVIVRAAPDAWVRCEVRALTRKSTYVTIELGEQGLDGKHTAHVRGGCFPTRMAEIDAAFADSGLRLEVGCKILVKLRAVLDPAYGFKVDLLDIDPSYTLGDFKTRVEAIRRRLREEGNWDRNRALAKPRDFVRVAVISPAGAAGLGDFRATAQRLAERGLVEFIYFEAPFQTAQSPVKIISALRAMFRECRDGRYCAVAIIRGGGAASDLAWLADYDLARAVCLMPVPVITGIGHQHDSTLLDEVAAIRCDTPSKAAEWIRTTVVTVALEAKRDLDEIHNRAKLDVELLSAQVESELSNLMAGAQKAAGAWDGNLRSALNAIFACTRSLLDRSRPLTDTALRIALAAGRECRDVAAAGIADAYRTTLRLAEGQVTAASESVAYATRIAEQAPHLAILAYAVSIQAATHQVTTAATAALKHFENHLELMQQIMTSAPREIAGHASEVVRREMFAIAGSCAAQLRAVEMPVRHLAEEVRAIPSNTVSSVDTAVRALVATCVANAGAALGEIAFDFSRLDGERKAAIPAVPAEAARMLGVLLDGIHSDVRRSISDMAVFVGNVQATADALDPASVVAAGYAILRDPAGRPLTGVDRVRTAGIVTVEMRDGMAQLKSIDEGETE